MIKSIFFTFSLLSCFPLLSQEKVFVVDSIMDAYMRSGYADKHWIGKGKFDKNDKQTGKWQDYEVRFDNVFLIDKEGLPFVKPGMYLIGGKGEYLTGKRIGEWKLFALEDQSFKHLHFKTANYVDGELEGPATYHFPNGNTAAEANYRNDQLEGEFTQYYENGQPSVVSTLSKSIRNGKQTAYFPSGSLKWEKNYTNDSLHGECIHYYENGNVQWSQEYNMGAENGTYKYHHENGQLWTEKIYENGRVKEVVSSFDSSGKKLDAGTLKNGSGTVKYYQHSGELYLIETYENGVVVSEDRSGEFEW